MTSSSDPLAVFAVSGMTCGSCEVRVRSALRALPGVHDAVVSRAASRATVSHDPTMVDQAALAQAIVAAGYAVVAIDPPGADPERPVSQGACCPR